jgi:RNA polymerase sigma-70 factor (ECF subfamily)
MAHDTKRAKMNTFSATLDAPMPNDSMERPSEAALSLDFRAFYERHFRFVYRIVARMADQSADVDDLTQEIFTIAGQKLDAFEGRAKETTWLYRITANVISADRRKRRRQHLLSLRWLVPSPDDEIVEGPDRDLERLDAQSLVRDVLKGMSEKKSSVFVLFELEGLPGQEVADIVGCPLDTMWTRLFHARREFKAKLAERGFRSSEDLERVPGMDK